MNAEKTKCLKQLKGGNKTEQVIMKKPRRILVSEVETTTNGTEKNVLKRNFPYIKEYRNARIKRLHAFLQQCDKTNSHLTCNNQLCELRG